MTQKNEMLELLAEVYGARPDSEYLLVTLFGVAAVGEPSR